MEEVGTQHPLPHKVCLGEQVMVWAQLGSLTPGGVPPPPLPLPHPLQTLALRSQMGSGTLCPATVSIPMIVRMEARREQMDGSHWRMMLLVLGALVNRHKSAHGTSLQAVKEVERAQEVAVRGMGNVVVTEGEVISRA